MLHNITDGRRYGSIERYSGGRRGRGLGEIEFPHYGSLARYSRGTRGRDAQFGDVEFGDMEGIWGSITGAAKKVGSVTKSVAGKVVHSAESAGKLPFQAVNKVASSGVRLVSGIAKETGKLGGTILAAPAKVSIEATKGVIGGIKGTIGKITNPFKSSSGTSASPADTAAAAAEVAKSQGLDPGTGGAVSSTSSTLTSSGSSAAPSYNTASSGGGSPTFDPAAAQAALDAGATPAEAVKAGADAAAGGIPKWAWYAGAGVGAIALFLVVKKMRRRGGARTKS